MINKFDLFLCRYISGEKKRLESMTDAMKVADQIQLAYLKDLRAELQKVYERGVRIRILFRNYPAYECYKIIYFFEMLVVASISWSANKYYISIKLVINTLTLK